ncbi:MAG: Rne/Rng family ribonuclease [Bacteroidota bacterium]
MNKELIIDSTSSEIVIALLEEKRLVELHVEKNDNNFSVGDIYLGRVKKIIPGLNAAFVDVGYEKDAFLHYLDLGPQIKSLNKYVKNIQSKKTYSSIEELENESDIEKSGKIASVLTANQNIVVQIAKEPISTKGPRISTEISLAGRYLVLIPFSDKVSVSQKIKSQDERSRLKRLIHSIKPKNFGVIIRTASENKKVAELDADLRDLFEKWELGMQQLPEAKPPQKILGEINRTSAILRDILNPNFNSVTVNDKALGDIVKSYLANISSEYKDIVKVYKGKEPIFESFGIEKQIKGSFGKIVTIKSGVYLVIEHTEALHVIDVNSGHRMNSQETQENNALEVNLEAASEIARQLRLRDMGGIIVVDFIDMHEGQNRRKLYERLKAEMLNDRAKHTILPPSKFGLVQITRQRVRPEMNIETYEKCPCCDGTGKIKASILFIDEIENNIKYILHEQNQKNLKLFVHPYIYAYLKKGIYNMQVKWLFKYKKWIEIEQLTSYNLLEYHFFDKNGEEIKI